MNYAALIAILAALAFALPFLVSVAERIGIPRGYGIVTTLVTVIFVTAWIVIRQRVQTRTAIEERVAAIERERAARPDDPNSFYLYGDHLGDLYLTLGRTRDALTAFETHLDLAHRHGKDPTKLERAVHRLRQQLAQGGDDASL